MIKNKLCKLILLSACSLLLLTGCHGSKNLDGFKVPETFDESKPIEITFWAKNDTNVAQTDIYKKSIAEFQKIYPNIKVSMKLYTDYGRIYNDVITNISTGTTPNVCITYPDHIATYMTGKNVVVPLDNIMTDERYGLGGSEIKFDSPSVAEMIPQYLNEGIINGTQYAIPFMRSTEACYINKDMVEALGYEVPDVLTWDFIFEVSEKAMEKDASGNYRINSQSVLIPFIYKSTDNMLITMLKQKNAGYCDENGNIEIFNDTTTEILKEVASHAETGAFSTFKISSYPANYLDAGQCIFAIDSTAGATWMGSSAPLSDISDEQRIDFTTVVRPVPQYDPDNMYMMSQGPSICIFNKDDEQTVLASWLFTQYLISNGVQIPYSQTEGYVPVTKKARESEEYLNYVNHEYDSSSMYYETKLDATKLLLSNTENTFVTPVFNGSASLRDAAGALIENVVKAKRRHKTVDDAFIQQNYQDVTSLYRLDQKNLSADGKKDLGPLPAESRALIITLIAVWILIGVYALIDKKRRA